MDVKTALARVEELSKGLTARKTRKEDREVYEDVLDSRYTWGSTQSRQFVGMEEVSVDDGPDLERQEKSRAELQGIYNGEGEEAEWFSARYVAGKALGLSDDELGENLNSWLNDLKEKLGAMTTTTEGGGSDTYVSPFSATGSFYITEEWEGQEVTVPDEITRQFSRANLRHMYEHLPHQKDRVLVGKVLGYSPLRIWAHEHPVAAALAGLAGAGAAGYALFELLR